LRGQAGVPAGSAGSIAIGMVWPDAPGFLAFRQCSHTVARPGGVTALVPRGRVHERYHDFCRATMRGRHRCQIGRGLVPRMPAGRTSE
jgi:hypothetical protein